MDSQPNSIGHKRPRSYPKIPSEWSLEFPEKGSTDNTLFGGTRRIEDAYEKLIPLGQGTYGEVFKAIDKETQETVAIKKIKMENEKEGFPITAVREIKILSSLAAAPETLDDQLLRNNIIRLREIVRSDSHDVNHGKGSVYMVFDYMQHDMAGLLERANRLRTAEAAKQGKAKPDPPFELGQVKRYVYQLLKGLELLRRRDTLHRDLKNANLLVNNEGELKIADFGLARTIFINESKENNSKDNEPGIKDNTKQQSDSKKTVQQPNQLMTNRVITLWYRPPELCLGCVHYAMEVDMWSAGCIMAEMLTGKALFPGKDEVDQVKLICGVLGAPTVKNIPQCQQWKDYNKIMQALSSVSFPTQSILRQTLQKKGIIDPGALDLLEKLLTLDPSKRLTARDAALHGWFNEGMTPLGQMPVYDDSHELGMKISRAAMKEHARRGGRGGAASGGQRRGPTQVAAPLPSNTTTYQRHHGSGSGSGYGRGGSSQAAQPSWQQERR